MTARQSVGSSVVKSDLMGRQGTAILVIRRLACQ
jgi:hypothetical protein